MISSTSLKRICSVCQLGLFIQYYGTLDFDYSSEVPYQYRYRTPYDRSQRQIDFAVHGGFRKASWSLGGGLLDNDLDGVCDAVDPDDDNDGVPAVRDNCPLVADPDQRDNDHNGIRFACDPCELCMARLASDSATATQVSVAELWPGKHSCRCVGECGYEFCSSSDDELTPLDDDFNKAINFLHSKWWNLLVANPELPPVRPGPIPPAGAEVHLPAMAREIGALLHFKAKGVSPAASQRTVWEALFGAQGLGKRAPGSDPPDRGIVRPR